MTSLLKHFKGKWLRFIPVVFLSGAGAHGPDHRAAGWGLPEEEPRHSAGPPDPHAQREHQHSDQRVGAQREGSAEDPQRGQSADQVWLSGDGIQPINLHPWVNRKPEQDFSAVLERPKAAMPDSEGVCYPELVRETSAVFSVTFCLCLLKY